MENSSGKRPKAHQSLPAKLMAKSKKSKVVVRKSNVPSPPPLPPAQYAQLDGVALNSDLADGFQQMPPEYEQQIAAPKGKARSKIPAPPPPPDAPLEPLQCRIELKAWDYEDPRRAGFIRINGESYTETQDDVNNPTRGLFIVTLLMLDDRYRVDKCEHFDVWEDEKEAHRLEEFIEGLKVYTVVVGVSADEIKKNLRHFKDALEDLGVDTSVIDYRGSICFIAKKGYPGWANQKAATRHNGPVQLAKAITAQENARLQIQAKDLVKGKKKLKSLDGSKKKKVPTATLR